MYLIIIRDDDTSVNKLKGVKKIVIEKCKVHHPCVTPLQDNKTFDLKSDVLVNIHHQICGQVIGKRH